MPGLMYPIFCVTFDVGVVRLCPVYSIPLLWKIFLVQFVTLSLFNFAVLDEERSLGHGEEGEEDAGEEADRDGGGAQGILLLYIIIIIIYHIYIYYYTIWLIDFILADGWFIDLGIRQSIHLIWKLEGGGRLWMYFLMKNGWWIFVFSLFICNGAKITSFVFNGYRYRKYSVIVLSWLIPSFVVFPVWSFL